MSVSLPPRPSRPSEARLLGIRAVFAIALLSLLAPGLAAAQIDPADEVVDDVPEDGPDVSPVTPARLLASTEDLYDFTPLADGDVRYAALLQAWQRHDHAAVVRQALEVASRTGQAAVRVAALHLLARSYERVKNRPEAERAWQRLAQSGPFTQTARQHLANLALERGDVDGALAQLAAVAPWHVGRDAATLLMAKIELDRGRIGPARDALERVQRASLPSEHKAWHALLSGEVARRSGQVDAAVRYYREAWWLDEGAYSGTASDRLAAMEVPIPPGDQVERILERRPRGRNDLRRWLGDVASIAAGDQALRAYGEGALLSRDKKTRKRALELLESATNQATDPVQLGRALHAWGDALGKAGNDAKAIETLQRALTVGAGEELEARALQRLHRLYNNVNRPQDAEEALVRLLERHPAAEERELAVWGLAWQRYLAGNYPGALKGFVQLEREFGQQWTGGQQPWRAKAIYWQGRCLAHMKHTDAAIDAWSSVANMYAQTYYGVISLDRVREIDPERAARLQGPPPSPAGTGPTALSLDRVRVSRHPALDEAALLVRMGLESEARTLLKGQIQRGLPRDGIHLLATLYEQEGQRKAAYGIMQRHTRRAARPDEATAGVWRQSFPVPFGDEAQTAVAQAGISKSLLYAIMRHESGFSPTALSPVGARGLVQLMPTSARSIAELYGIPSLGAGALSRPGYNLQIGALFLSQLLSFYRSNHVIVAAAYNAGPYAAAGWVKKWRHLPTDAFVESIPYPITRTYVMQVTASAQTYAWLYPEWGEIERDQLGRSPAMPGTFGPFMKRPDDSESLRAAVN